MRGWRALTLQREDDPPRLHPVTSFDEPDLRLGLSGAGSCSSRYGLGGAGLQRPECDLFFSEEL